MYQGLGQMLTMCLQHHQGCSDTPKCAYVIYGQPLTLNDKLHSSMASLMMMLDVTVPAREIRRRVASYPEFCSAGCMLHDTISITMYSICTVSCSVQLYSTAVMQCTAQYSVQYHAVYSVQVPGADLWHLMMRNVALLGWGRGRNTPGAWRLVWGSAFTPALIILLINWNLELQTFSFVLNLQIGFNIVQVQCQCYGEDSVTCVHPFLLRPSQQRRPGDIM